MKKIIFNAMIIDDKPTGLGIYSQNILRNIIKDYNRKVDKIICKDANYLHTSDSKILELCYKEGKFGFIKRNYLFNKALNDLDLSNDDIVYSPTHHGSLYSKAKQIITIHDLIPLKYPNGRYHQYFYYKYILPLIIKNSSKIITVSENTKNDVIKEYKVNPNKVHVVYNGCEQNIELNKERSIEYIKRKYNLSEYILMIGIHAEYKNLHSIIKAYNRLKDKIKNKLVIVGNDNCLYGKRLKKLVEELGLSEQVIFLGYIDENDKNMIYQAASLFVYPSKYEGFGLPILESMSNGTPIICSNTSSLPEVVVNKEIMFNPDNIEEIVIKIQKILFLDNKMREELVEKGFKNIKRFNWEKTTNEIVSIIDEIQFHGNID